jgi:23S rRNA (adenine2503-C2)-methyltransferase
MSRVRILDLSFQELAALLTGWGEPPYRARQLWQWLWRKWATSFQEMTDLPSALRERLACEFQLEVARPGAVQLDAEEGTEKVLLSLLDGEKIEAVLIRDEGRRTVCVSTQVGCPVGCRFCATGQMGFVRNLTPGEIAAQVLHFARRLASQGERVTHVVVMGMGEPLLNYQATLRALHNLHHPQGFALGGRKITLSTVGVVPGIRKLVREGLPLNLAISLHAPRDELRRKLVPWDKQWGVREMVEAADEYAAATGRRVTYEYVLLRGVNDGLREARELGKLLRGRLAHVNLIPFNPAPGLPFHRPPPRRVEAFREELLRWGVDVTVRRSRGVRIRAACGQLRTRVGAKDAGFSSRLP